MFPPGCYLLVADWDPVLRGWLITRIRPYLRLRHAGSLDASCILLGLPHGVKNLFEDWLREHCSDRASRGLNQIRETRLEKLNDPRLAT